MELIKVTEENGEQLVSARDLHEFLEVKRDFSDWIKAYINNSDYGFEEGLDYTIIKGFSSTSTPRPRIEYILKLETALIIARCVKYNEKAIEIIDFIQNKLGKTIEIKKIKRAEDYFGDMLEKITGFKWEKQISIDNGRFFLDFYLKNTLIVEYDEEHHVHSVQKDHERIIFCRDWIAKNREEYDDGWRCPVIRVKKGCELDGLNRIIRHLVGFEMFEEQNNYNLKVCDYGIK